jgi:hypothetical protein
MLRDRQEFLRLIGPELSERLDLRRDAACGVWPDFTIAYVNPAWLRFARANGADGEFSSSWCEGASFLDGIGGRLREFYRSHCQAVLDGGAPWMSEYECSSPKLFRLYSMEVRRVGEGEALLVTHTRVVQCPHEQGVFLREPLDSAPWKDEHGLVHQCVHCRRVRRAGEAEQWDWVPQWVEHVPEFATGSLCPHCIATRYPELADQA